jgi:hypothetical protein
MESQSFRAILPSQDYIPLSVKRSTPRQVLSKDQWEELKPIIDRLYMKENRTFRQISGILGESYGFAPTKTQFNIRLKQWGFKKNASRQNRLEFLNNPDKLGTIERAVKPTTRKRWEKEFQKGKITLIIISLQVVM